MYNLKIIIKSLKNINNKKIKYLYLHKIQQHLKIKSLKIQGNISHKNKNKTFTVLKSPHVYKKSQEKFNYKLYKRCFYILDSNFLNLIHFLIILKKILPKNLLLKIRLKKN